MSTHKIDVDQAAKDVLKVLRRHNIPDSGIDYLFERVKALAHENKVAYPRYFSDEKGENCV